MYMELKNQVLEALEQNKGTYLSGSALAKKLHCSRNAVWKAVRALGAEGHVIAAVTNKGYCLADADDILSPASITKYLGDQKVLFSIEVYKSLDSTNTLLKTLAGQGAPEGTVIVAEAQTAGRGRMERTFFSPAGKGVYFSLLLRPDVNAADATRITTAAAVAVAEALESVAGVPAAIKWVNDVFVGDRKVCGILTEGAFNMETGGMEYVVLGIGVNVATPTGGFPPELAGIAAAVKAASEPGLKSRLIAEILKRFWSYFVGLEDKSYLAAYKKKSFILGRAVDVITGATARRATALDIDGDCRLVVRYEDGETAALYSGEVRIRPAAPSAG
jgi:BirA family biotin operon repressor/biotin-[acetyl-CoA-carboxylase] ligase